MPATNSGHSEDRSSSEDSAAQGTVAHQEEEALPYPMRRALLFGLLAFFLALGRHLPFANERFYNWEWAPARAFETRFANYWDTHGFLATEGRPIRGELPYLRTPEKIYANHPPLGHWLIYFGTVLFGDDRAGVRSFPTLAHALGAFLLAAFIARQLGFWGGLAGAVIYNSLPMTFFFGRSPNYEPFIVLFAFLGHMCFVSARTKGSLAISMCAWFITSWIDWVALLIAGPVILIERVTSQDRRGKLRWPIFACLFGFSTYFALLSYWNYSIDGAILNIQRAAKMGMVSVIDPTWAEFCQRQLYFLIRLFSWAGVAILSLGSLYALVQICRRRCSLMVSMGLVWVIAGAANVVLFRGRSFTHEMFWYYASPAVALFGSAMIAATAKRARIIGCIVLVVIAAMGVRRTVLTYEDSNRPEQNKMVALFDKYFDMNTLVANLTYGAHESWNIRALSWNFDGKTDRDAMRKMVDDYLGRKMFMTKLVIWYDPTDEEFKKEQIPWMLGRGGKIETHEGLYFIRFPERK